MLTEDTAARAAARFVETIAPYPGHFSGRGIVTCAGAIHYNTCAWVLIHMLRRLGCTLPIEVWYLGDRERDDRWIELVKPLGVRCIDALKVAQRHPHPRLRGWELKPFAILHSDFEEILFLDADNVPVVDPTFLFDTPQYRKTGTIFWPFGHRNPPDDPCWVAFGVPYRDECDLESGQMLIDKRRAWQALNLCNWYNERSDFFYEYVYGDKDTFRFAWHRLGQVYAFLPTKPKRFRGTLYQHDFEGRRIFQHRYRAKWIAAGSPPVPRFRFEKECLAYLAALREKWSPLDRLADGASFADQEEFERHVGSAMLYCDRKSRTPLQLCAGGHVAGGVRLRAVFWWVADGQLVLADEDGHTTYRFTPDTDDTWTADGCRLQQETGRLTPA